MPKLESQSSTVIDAPIERVFALVAQLERVPEWQDAVAAAEILERDAAGHPRLVRTSVRTPIKTAEAVLAVRCVPHTSVTWTQEEGDAARFDGGWTLTDLDEGRTLAEYEVQIDFGRTLGMFVRGPVRAVGVAAVSSMPSRLSAFVARA